MRAVAVLALCAGLLVAVPPSAGAQESCNGSPATIVGTPGGAVVGTADRDVVVTDGADSVDTLDGTDVVCITGDLPTTVDGGPGRDRLVVAMPDGQVRLDLGGNWIQVRPGGDGTVTGFEDATVRAHDAFLDGTSGPNNLRWNLCTGTVTGQRGDDRVAWTRGPDLCRSGDDRTVALHGGAGTDHLTGSPWADILIGGDSRDTGDGRGGVDRCRVEVARHCEVVR